MDDDKRLLALLDLAKQHMQRGRELEDIEWKLSFSIGAFLGGLAYLWVNAHLKAPAWIQELPAVPLIPLFVALLHAGFQGCLRMLSNEEGELCDGYRRDILTLIGRSDATHLYTVRRPRWHEQLISSWVLLITLIIGLAVILLIRSGNSSAAKSHTSQTIWLDTPCR